MPDQMQSYANHGRFRPLFHFSTLPIFLVNAIVFIVQAVREPGLLTAWLAIVFIALFLFAFDNRTATVTLQDRIIRDEMRLRLERLLGPGAREKIAKLTPEQCIGLRFASDAELPALVERAAAGELATRKSIKMLVKDWQADHLRA